MEEIEELKSTLRSLAVSSPVKMTVMALLRDYRNMVGKQLPVEKFGYRDALSFLKERCSDSFLFQGSGANTVLVPIVRESVKHIDQMVQKQKVDSKMKSKGKRWSVAETILAPAPDLIARTFPAAIKRTEPKEIYRAPEARPNYIKNNSTPTKIQNTEKPNYIKYTSTPTKIQNTEIEALIQMRAVTKSQNKDTSMPDLKSNLEKYKSAQKLNDHYEDDKLARGTNMDAYQNFLRKRLPVFDGSQDLDRDCDSGKCTSESETRSASSSSSAKQMQLEQLKSDVTRLVLESDGGVLCTDLMKLYRERYGRELEFSRFRFTSVAALALSLPGVRAVRDGAGTRLLPASAPPPAPAPLPTHPVSRASRQNLAQSSSTVNQTTEDDALPWIDFDPDVFPADCMSFADSIPPQSLDDISPSSLLEVMIGEVYSPSHFWFYRLGERYHIAMEDTMDQMTKYYTKGEGKDRVLALGAVRVGHYCSSVYDNDWHRSLIVKIEDADTVKVLHVDYGTVDRVPRSGLKPLLRKWASLPAQAIRARLAGVRPAGGGRCWPHPASAAFLRLVCDRQLVANVVGVDRAEDIIEMFLVDTTTSSEKDIRIDMELIHSGYADPRTGTHEHALAESYLYPRFSALETGDTPNYAEIYTCLKHGIALDFVEEYRRHVPSALPPEPHPRAPAPAAALPLYNRIPLLPRHSETEPGPPSEDESEEEEQSEAEPAEEKPDTEQEEAKCVEPEVPKSASVTVPAAQVPPQRVAPPLQAVAPQTHVYSPPPLLTTAPTFYPLAPMYAPPFPGMPPLHPAMPPLHPAMPYSYQSMSPWRSMEMFGSSPRYIPPNSFQQHPAPRLQHPLSVVYPPQRLPMPCANISQAPPAPAVSLPQSLHGSTLNLAQPPQVSPIGISQPPPPPPAPLQARVLGAPSSDGRQVLGTQAGDVSLTASECEIFNFLSLVDQNAAYCYIVSAINRKRDRNSPASFSQLPSLPVSLSASASQLNPLATEFQSNEYSEAMEPPPGFNAN